MFKGSRDEVGRQWKVKGMEEPEEVLVGQLMDVPQRGFKMNGPVYGLVLNNLEVPDTEEQTSV